MPLWSKILVVTLLILLASIGFFNSSLRQQLESDKAKNADDDTVEVAARKSLPDLQLVDAQGSAQKLSTYRGQVVILSFWASWCGTCLTELPTFAEMEHKFQGRGLRILTVNVDEDADEGKRFAKDFWRNKKLGFPTFFDQDRHLVEQFSIDMLPSNFVLDRQGRLVFSGFGATDWNSPQAQELLENLLSEKKSI